MMATATAGAQLVGYRSELTELRPEAVLAYVRARLASPASLPGQLRGAAAVVSGTVERVAFRLHTPSATLRATNPELAAALGHGPDGPASLLTLQVAEIAVSEWLVPAAGPARVSVAWVLGGSTAAPDPGLYPVSKSGLFVLPRVDGPLAVAVASFEPGAYFWPGGAPVFVADPAGETRAACRFYLAALGQPAPARLAAAGAALESPVAAQRLLALALLGEGGPAAVAELVAALARGRLNAATALAARATLAALGASEAAAAGLDVTELDAAALNAFNWVVLPDDAGKPWLLQGPAPDIGLAPAALDP